MTRNGCIADRSRTRPSRLAEGTEQVTPAALRCDFPSDPGGGGAVALPATARGQNTDNTDNPTQRSSGHGRESACPALNYRQPFRATPKTVKTPQLEAEVFAEKQPPCTARQRRRRITLMPAPLPSNNLRKHQELSYTTYSGVCRADRQNVVVPTAVSAVPQKKHKKKHPPPPDATQTDKTRR